MTVSKRILYPVFIVTMVLAAYSFQIGASFKTMDDVGSIIENEWIKDFSHAGEIFRSSFFGRQAYYRPLVSLSFMLEYHFFGLNAFPYYVTNIVLHALVSAVLFFLLAHLFRREVLAFATALLFGIHPIHWEAVTNIPGRAILLSAFFVLCSLLAFVKSEDHKKLRIAAWLCFGLALLSKESAAVFPAVLLSYQYFIGRKPQQKPAGWLWPLAPFAAIEVVYLCVRRGLGISKFYYWNSLGEALLGFATFLRSMLTNVRLLFFPVGLHFDRSCALFDSWVDVGLIMTVFVWGLMASLVWKFRRRISPVFFFFLSWSCLEMAPVSQLIFSIGVQPGRISVAEHFVYVSAIGLLALIGWGAHEVFQYGAGRKAISPKVGKGALAGVYVFLMIMTVQQSFYSSQEIAMFEQTLKLSPQNTRIRNSLAYAYARVYRFEEAEHHFRKTLDVLPADSWALIGLGKSLCDQGKYWDGLHIYERIQDAGGLEHTLRDNIEKTYQVLARKYEAKAAAGEDDFRVPYSLGVVYSKQGRMDDAIRQYRLALKRNPQSRDALFNLGGLLESQGNVSQAVSVYEKMVSLGDEPTELDRHVFTRLVEIYERLGDNTKAQAYRKRLEECEDACPMEE